MLGLPGSATPSGLCCNWVCTRPVRGPRGTLSSPTRRRRGGPVTARRRRAGPGRGAARTGRSTSCVRRRAERTCGAWRRRTAVSGAGPAAVCGESRRWALGGTRGDRACRGAVHACVHGGRAKQGGIGRRGTCSPQSCRRRSARASPERFERARVACGVTGPTYGAGASSGRRGRAHRRRGSPLSASTVERLWTAFAGCVDALEHRPPQHRAVCEAWSTYSRRRTSPNARAPATGRSEQNATRA